MPKRPFEPVLGIDLDSANSACAIYMEGAPIPIPNEKGVKTTPSFVSFRSSDKKIGKLEIQHMKDLD
jgi:molecular chaperone DnaK (HSP70)